MDNQIRGNDPPETRETLERLLRDGYSRQDARLLIGQAVAVEIYAISKEKKPFNRERFLRNLRRLPAEPSDEP